MNYKYKMILDFRGCNQQGVASKMLMESYRLNKQQNNIGFIKL